MSDASTFEGTITSVDFDRGSGVIELHDKTHVFFELSVAEDPGGLQVGTAVVCQVKNHLVTRVRPSGGAVQRQNGRKVKRAITRQALSFIVREVLLTSKPSEAHWRLVGAVSEKAKQLGHDTNHNIIAGLITTLRKELIMNQDLPLHGFWSEAHNEQSGCAMHWQDVNGQIVRVTHVTSGSGIGLYREAYPDARYISKLAHFVGRYPNGMFQEEGLRLPH